MRTSLPANQATHAPDRSDVKKVPFVELFDGRLQGVVSSGSDINRVYVSFFVAGSLNYSCSTNNNRPCGGLRGYPCNHLQELLGEALTRFGAERVVQFLQLSLDPAQVHYVHHLTRHAGQPISDSSGSVFSRFLSHLELLELPPQHGPLHTMAWFI